MAQLKAVGIKNLSAMDIIDVVNGCDQTPKCGSYGAYTLTTKNDRKYVLWTSYGEINLSEIVET